MSSAEYLKPLQAIAGILQTELQQRPDGSYYALGKDPAGHLVSLAAEQVTPEVRLWNIKVIDPKLHLYDAGAYTGVGLINPVVIIEPDGDTVAITDPRGERFIVGRNLPATVHHAANPQRE